MQEYIEMWKRYADFKGRTTVRGYWMAFLFNFIIALVLGVLTQFVSILGILSGLYTLAAMIPGIALGVRRLHDINKSGFCIFLSLIPIVGAILLLVWFCKAGDAGSNNYGEPATSSAY